ncbi:MAG: class I SAM-dependent methyltransferase [Bacteroidota bacterium]
MTTVPGTSGYAAVVQRYIKVTEEIPFEVLHRDFLPFLPESPSLIVDVGAGTGRDAYVLSEKGHQVLAIEPLQAFREAAKKRYPSTTWKWIDDALPKLDKLVTFDHQVDFILSSGMWHHLNAAEQQLAMARIAQLLRPGGIAALSLRNGPAGAGSCVFPVPFQQTIAQAKACHLEPLLALDNQPSLMKNKTKVNWSRLVLRKVAVSLGREQRSDLGRIP